MATDPKNTIAFLLEKDHQIILETLDSTKVLLERLYETQEGQFSREELQKDLIKIVEILIRIQSTDDVVDKLKIFFDEYHIVAKELKSKYSDFLPSAALKKLDSEQKYAEAVKNIITSQLYIMQGFEEKEPLLKASKLYTGMVKFSEVLEDYISYFPHNFIEVIKKIPIEILKDPALKPETAEDEKVKNYLTSIRSTARAILWQIDNYKKEKKHTVGELLDWLSTSPGWAGDDFEECLEYVKQVRK